MLLNRINFREILNFSSSRLQRTLHRRFSAVKICLSNTVKTNTLTDLKKTHYQVDREHKFGTNIVWNF